MEQAQHFLQIKLLTWKENVPTCTALVARGPVMDPEGIPSRESRPCERLTTGTSGNRQKLIPLFIQIAISYTFF